MTVTPEAMGEALRRLTTLETQVTDLTAHKARADARLTAAEGQVAVLSRGLETVSAGLAATNSQLAPLVQNQATLETEHQQLHHDVQAAAIAAAQAQAASRQPGQSSSRPQIPDKGLAPEPYSGTKEMWFEWAAKFMNYRCSSFPDLRKAMIEVMGAPDALTDTQMEAYGIAPESLRGLKSYLSGRLTGDAWLVAEGAQEEHALEMWRRVARCGNPLGANAEGEEIDAILGPSAAGKASEIMATIQVWENRVARYRRVKNEKPVSDNSAKHILLKFLPPAQRKEIQPQIRR